MIFLPEIDNKPNHQITFQIIENNNRSAIFGLLLVSTIINHIYIYIY